MAVLEWEVRGERKRHHLGQETRIGRGPDNHVQIPERGLSRHHARVVCHNGIWFIEDQGSTNGTLLNGKRVEQSELKDGDIIAIGQTNLKFISHVASIAASSDIGTRLAGDDSMVSGLWDDKGTLNTVFRDDSDITRRGSSISLKVEPTIIHGAGRASADLAALRLETTLKISRAVAATLDLHEVMDRVLDAVFDLLKAAERAFILLVDPQTRQVTDSTVKRRVPEDTQEISFSRTALEQSLDRREAILCVDAMRDTQVAPSQSIISLGIRSMMIAPLIFQDEVLGAIYVDTHSEAGKFKPGDLDLLSVAAVQVAGCVANAQMHAQVVATERLAAVGQTVAGLAHCIKNILQGIHGGSFIIERAMDKGNEENVRKGWDMVKRNNAFMEQLVFDLLSYSKERKPEYEPTDLNALCSEIAQLAAARADTRGIKVEMELADDVEIAEIDPKGIRRCLLNLAMNAVDACADNEGRVTIGTRCQNGTARVTIQDNGCGMSEETQAKLFTAFFSTKGSKGTGLGLPVSRKIVEEHGGRIDIDSHEGEGTLFTICLPMVRPTEVGGSSTATDLAPPTVG